MTSVSDLLAGVTSRYAVQQLPAWPDPWPDREPDEDAYSRLTDPERYEILFRRADAWLAGLAEVPGITVETIDAPASPSRGGHPYARARRVTSERAGAARLLVLERDEPMPVIAFALGDPAAVLEEQPDCGCDACDSGSDDLLRVVDQLFVAVLTSPVVVLRGAEDRWHAQWSRYERQAGGSPSAPRSFKELMAQCERIAAGEDVDLPPGTQVWTSQAWLGKVTVDGFPPLG